MARRHHPDRFAGDDGVSGSAAADTMARANEAWRVLGHPGRRRVYDAGLRGDDLWQRPVAPPAFGDDDLVDVAPARPSLLRGLPWLFLLGALGLIFVFTAYAASGSGGSAEPSPTGVADRLGTCIDADPGPVTTEVPCSRPHDGQIVEVLPFRQPCPADTRALHLPAEELTVCLAA